MSDALPSMQPQRPQRPYSLTRIDHVVIRCHEFDSMFHFYTEILGCTIDEPREANVGRFGGALSHLRAGESAMIDLMSYDYQSNLSQEGQEMISKMHLSGRKNLDPAILENVKALASQFASKSSTMDHLCLRVDPFNEKEICEYLESHSIPIIASGQRKGAEGVGTSIYISDPEGNVIELKGPPNSQK